MVRGGVVVFGGRQPTCILVVAEEAVIENVLHRVSADGEQRLPRPYPGPLRRGMAVDGCNDSAHRSLLEILAFYSRRLTFQTYLMDEPRPCANHCLFCFVDQMAPGCRDTLYFKDDDARLSFLMGNYITPRRLPVHRTELRQPLPEFGQAHRHHRAAGEPPRGHVLHGPLELRPVVVPGTQHDLPVHHDARRPEPPHGLQALAARLAAQEGGAEPGVGGVDRDVDGADAQVDDPLDLPGGEVGEGCSVVPVGLTKFREGLSKLRPVDRETAGQIIDQVDAFGEKCLEACGTRMFFCSDELYIRAGRPLPEEAYYEDYVQIENGVGMLRSLIAEFEAALRLEDGAAEAAPYTIATGVSARPFLQQLADKARERTGAAGQAVAIENDFFGHTIDVAGLITGGDLIAQLKGRDLGARLLIPVNMLRHGGERLPLGQHIQKDVGINHQPHNAPTAPPAKLLRPAPPAAFPSAGR